MSIEIDLTELRQVFSLLMDHLEAYRGSVITSERVNYWQVTRNWLRLDEPVSGELTVESFEHDLEQLHEISVHDELPAGLGFVWIAALLRLLGEENPR